MAFESFKHYCPECGEYIKLSKAANGNFRCPDCQCEYRRSWLPWLVVGVPAVAWGVLAFGTLPGVWLWRISDGLLFCGLAIIFVLFWFCGPKEFVVVKHGREFSGSRQDEKKL